MISTVNISFPEGASLKKICIFVLIFFAFIRLALGQGVTITSPQSPGPTSVNPIEVFLSFKDAVNSSITNDLNIVNGTISSEIRQTPTFEYLGSENLPTIPIIASIPDYLGQGFPLPSVDEYIQGKLKNVIVAFDVNSNDEIIYLTYANGVFRFRPGQSDIKLINNDFESPIDIAIDNEDRIIIADAEAYAVKVYSSDYNGLSSLLYTIGGAQGKDGNEFYGPTGLAISKENNLYVADAFTGSDPAGLDQVKIYSLGPTSETFIRRYGDDNLVDPFRIAVDNGGVVYVSDAGGVNGRIQIFSPSDEYKKTLANQASRSPASINVDEYGYLYSADYRGDINFREIYQDPESFLNRYDEIKEKDYPVLVYDKLDSEYNTTEIGQLPNELNLPIDIALDICGNILVMDIELGGYADLGSLDIDATLDFDVESFRRNDKFKLLVETIAEGTVQIELKNTDFFNCAPQPSGSFSIEYFIEGEDTPPEITCPANITRNNDPGECGAVVTFSAPEVTDDGGAITPIRTDSNTNLNSGDLFPVGTTTISYQADDGVNDPVTCSFTIKVNDNEDPVINCPTDIRENIAFGETGMVIDYDSPTIEDNCETSTLTQTAGLASGEVFTVGTTVNTFVVNDGNGNTDTCSFEVIITEDEEDTPPEISCPADITKINDPGECGAIVTFSAPEVTDDGGAITPTRTDGSGYNSGDLFPVGETTISYQAEDGVNAPVTCSFIITITDGEDPTISCPANILETVSEGSEGKVVIYNTPGFDDNCENVTITQTDGIISGNVFPVGSTTNTFVVTDAAGNNTDCSFTVTIEEAIPSFTCPTPQDLGQIVLNNNCDFEVPDYRNTVTNFQNIDDPIVYQNYIRNDDFVSITLEVYDGSDSVGECKFDIFIKDETPPQILNCSDLGETVTINEGDTYHLDDYRNFLQVEDCSDNEITQNPEPGFSISQTTNVTLTVTDESGLTDTCTFTVEVDVVEGEILKVSCPGSFSVLANENCTYSIPDFSTVVSANIEGATITQDREAGSNFDPNSDPFITVTATFEDQTDSCEIYLSPEDQEDPVASCVSNFEITIEEGETVQLNPQDFDSGSTDNCQIASYNLDRTSLSSNDEGENLITLTINDAAGNLDSCEVTVTVIVEEPGEIELSCLIVEYKLPPDENCEYFLPDLSEFVEYSPANADFEQSITPGTQLFRDAEVEVTVSYNGESKTCNLYVSLVEAEPQAICKPGFQIELEEGETVTIQPEDLDDGSFASCSEISLSLDKTEFTSADLGTNIVTLTVTNEAGDTATCQTEVNVILSGTGVNQPPVAIDEEYDTNINTPLDIPASMGVLVNDTDQENDELTAILQDDVSNGSLNLREDGSFTYTPDQDFTGQDYFTYVANDGEFNSNIIFVSINVEDNNGDFICAERLTLSLDAEGSAELNIEDLYTGNAEGIDINISERNFTCEDLGENILTLEYNGSQSGSCEIVVEVVDMAAPVLALRDLEISINQAGVATIVFKDLDAGSTDNCNGSVTYTLSESAFTCKELGENQVLVTAEDSSGNSSTRTAKVTVVDNAGYCDDPIQGSEYIFIYPNPNVGSFKIASPVDVQIERVEVFDHRGRFIAARDFENTVTEYAMDIGTLQESVYVVKIVTNEGTLTKRMIFKY